MDTANLTRRAFIDADIVDDFEAKGENITRSDALRLFGVAFDDGFDGTEIDEGPFEVATTVKVY
jgi:hypothetical protein